MRTLAGRRQLVRDFGTCLNFDGVGDFVNITNNASHNNLTGTWTCWINPPIPGIGNGSSILSKVDSSQSANGINIFFNSNKTLSVQVKSGTTSRVSDNTAVPLILGRWYMVTFAFNNGGAYKIYLNDTVISSNTMSGTFVFNNQVLRVAQALDGFWSAFNGQVDNVALYSSVMSDGEVSNLYYEGIIPTGLVSLYKFDEGSGTTVIDSQGIQNGTITNAIYSTRVVSKPRTLAVSRTLALNRTLAT